MKGSIIFLAEELEIADKKRKLNPSKTAINESTPDLNNTDQDMADTNPQGIGENSSSTNAAPPSTETAGTRLQKELRGRRRTNFFQMHGIGVNNQRGAMKFLSQKLLLQFLPMLEKLRPRTRWPDRG